MINSKLFAQIAFEHARDSLILTDEKGLVIWINNAFSRMSGYQLDDMLGKKPGDVLQGPLSSAKSKKILSSAVKSGKSCTTDIVNYQKSGKQYLAEIILSPIYNSKNQLKYYVAVQRDVTLQRAQSQESVDFRAYRRALDEQAIVSVADPSGIITYVNHKFNTISGYASSELIGKNHRIINSRTHTREFFSHMWREISKGNTWHGEVCNRAKSGDLYWVDTTIVPVNGADGEILRYVSIRYDITERKHAESELNRAASTDKLTGLLNRAGLQGELLEKLDNPHPQNMFSESVLIKIGIDHFKELNDGLGHQYGDLLLQEIARRLLLICQNRSVIARVGGDEFSIVLPSRKLSEQQLQALLENIHQSISNTLLLADHSYTPSCSMGVARFPQDAQSLEMLLINLDIALNEAKKSGRNQWLFFDVKVKEKLEYQKYLKSLLINALEHDLFTIVMQPICTIDTSQHVGFEVLVRLFDRGNPVPPDVFIPLAEEFGLIIPLGDQVMCKAMAAHRKLLDRGLAPGKMAINVGPAQFLEANFVDRVQENLREYDLDPTMLVIEITETALIGRSSKVVSNALFELQAIGIEVALDDFGTGFSSLSHLRDFNVNKIKIDKSFVNDIEHDSTARSLVEGLICFANKMGLDVVAEGVETEQQLQLLANYGCHYMQGYLHARPLGIEDAAAFITAANALDA